MGKAIGWILVIVAIFIAFQIGLFQKVADYFSASFSKTKQVEVIENDDGSYSEVRYRSIFSPLINKNDD